MALAVVEISGDRDNGLGYFFIKIRFGAGAHFFQNFCRHFFRRTDDVADFHPHLILLVGHELIGKSGLLGGHFGVAAPHEALDGTDGFAGAGNQLALGQIADDDLLVAFKENHRGGGLVALGIGNDFGFVAAQNGHDGVGCAQVNADDGESHTLAPLDEP
ncbi:MAG: hypothetical protein N3D11_08640 [Candidatus Sumerlaeia bacterium]|nr:hypothetical protein [Candidatus Sumerlaeia bacterium]